MNTKTKTTHNHNNTKSTKNGQKIVNWNEYSLALAKRGNLTVLIEEARQRNCFKKPLCRHTQGHPEEYPDELITFILVLREIYHQPLRQVRAFAQSALWSHGIVVRIPGIATLSRRAATLEIKLLPVEYYLHQGESIKLAVDSSGFKIHGEGEWFRKKHGAQKRREWQESHISLDVSSRLIPAILNTSSNVHDNTMLVPLLTETERNLRQTKITRPLECILGDGAYDCNENYHLAKRLNAKLVVPPPKNATLHYTVKGHHIAEDPEWHDRNEVVKEIQYRTGLEEWKAKTSYCQRSLVENAFYRIKNTFGDKMRNRTEANRNTEQKLRVMIMNQFTTYGLPKYAP